MDKFSQKRKIIAISGPTASGKSDLAVRLAKLFHGEVVSADSRQVYEGLDIGTGKITAQEMQGVPHHMLDVADPNTRYTAAEYKRDAEQVLERICAEGKLPILCGGTGFYIWAIVDNIAFPKAPPDKKLREKLEEKSPGDLFRMLSSIAPERACRVHPNNTRRVIRSLEIARAIGFVPPITKRPKYDALQIGIAVDSETLKKRIRNRLVRRIRGGMIEEVESLHEKGLSWERMEELGLEYRYVSRYLRNLMTKNEMIEKLNTEICRYAKRQRTWFKRDSRIKWFAPEETKKIESEVADFLNRQETSAPGILFRSSQNT